MINSKKNQRFLGLQKTDVFSRKGISPLIATVILIGIAIALFGVVFFWLSGLVSEQVQKFDKPIDIQCESLVFSVRVADNNVYINNQGNIPIAGIIVTAKINGKTLTSKAKMPVDGVVAAGETDVIDVSGIGFDISSAQTKTIIPILQGKTEKTGKTQRYICKTKGVSI